MSILKLVIGIFIFLASSFFAPTSVSAQIPVSTSSSLPSATSPLPPTVSPASPLYTDLLVHNLLHSFSCLAVGQSVIGQPCLTYQVTKNAQGMIQSVPVLSQVNTSGGVLGTTTSLIGMLYTNQPVRTSDYIGSLGKQFGIVKTANAQVVGSGAAVLNPILKLWQVSRNISYVIMIIIFVIIGIMIMFRHKINPQTVITAQAALPGLVIGLIMITFSYFLAGLISDMAFVGTNVVGYYFSAVRGEADKPQDLVGAISNKNTLSIFTPFTRIMSQPVIVGALGSIWDDLKDPKRDETDPLAEDPQKVLTQLAAMLVTQLIMPFASWAGGLGQLVAGTAVAVSVSTRPVDVVSVALSFVAMAILIYAMFRLLLRLINNYISIVFLTFSAPFQFLAAALPGRQGIATNWILNLLANVLAFPAVLAVFYFVAFLLGPTNNLNQGCIVAPNVPKPNSSCVFIISHAKQQDNNFASAAHAAEGDQAVNVVGKETFPLFGGLKLDFIRLLLAFGALIALPSIPDIINRAIGKMSQAGQMIGQEIGGSYGAGQRYAGQFQSGAGGMAGQVGRVSSDEGLVLTPKMKRDAEGNLVQDLKDGKLQYTWRRPDLSSHEEMMRAGTRAGQYGRLRAGVGNLLNKLRG